MSPSLKASSSLTLAATCALLLSASNAEAQTCGWEARAPMPTARFAHSSVTVNGKIYAIGGASNLEDPRAEVEVYDPATDTWEARAAMPAAAAYFGLDAIDRRIYRVGGVEVGGLTDRLTAYDIDTDTWTDLEPLPVTAAYVTATALDGKLYAVGGATEDGDDIVLLSSVHRYDPVADEWTAVAPLPRPRSAHRAAAASGKLYIVGGQEDVSALTNKVSVYDPATDTWSDVASAFTERAYPGVASHGGMLFIVGGFVADDGGAALLADLHRFDPATSTWTRLHDVRKPMALATATFVNDLLYVMGGTSDNSGVADVHALPVLAKSGVLHRTLPEASGANCAAGGTRLDTGFDTNCNGELDDGDTLETVYLCHGEDGSAAHELLVESTDEPAGDNCPNGGVRIDVGYDTDDDGELSTSEISETTYVCHGDKGPTGPDGSAGVDGVDGQDGEVGAEGGCAMARGTARDGSLVALGLSALAFFGLRRRREARA